MVPNGSTWIPARSFAAQVQVESRERVSQAVGHRMLPEPLLLISAPPTCLTVPLIPPSLPLNHPLCQLTPSGCDWCSGGALAVLLHPLSLQPQHQQNRTSLDRECVPPEDGNHRNGLSVSKVLVYPGVHHVAHVIIAGSGSKGQSARGTALLNCIQQHSTSPKAVPPLTHQQTGPKKQNSTRGGKMVHELHCFRTTCNSKGVFNRGASGRSSPLKSLAMEGRRIQNGGGEGS